VGALKLLCPYHTAVTFCSSVLLPAGQIAIISGSVTDAEQIALRERCSVRHVNMTISLAFLAPKLVHAAVEGRLPRGINIALARRSGGMESAVRSAWVEPAPIAQAPKHRRCRTAEVCSCATKAACPPLSLVPVMAGRGSTALVSRSASQAWINPQRPKISAIRLARLLMCVCRVL
jgi:hypothetical protein